MKIHSRIALALLTILFASPVIAQDSGRAPWRPSTGSFGTNCNAGYNATITSNNLQCSNTIANSTSATTAATATVATQAQSLNPTAVVPASQISGVIAAANLPASSGSGGNTCVSANFNASRSGSFSLTSPNGTLFSGGATGSVHGTAPSLGTGQTSSVTISGSGTDSSGNYGSVAVSGSVTVTCNANGTYSYSNYSWGGSDNYHDDIYRNVGGS